MTKVFVSTKDVNYSDYKWIDARFSLADVQAGFNDYKEGHVVGAIHWDLNEDLSASKETGGRHPLPEKEQLIELFSASGLSLDDAIIIYDDGGSPFATRAWWILQYAGFTNASIALEGVQKMQEYGIPMDTQIPQPEKATISPNWNETIYANREDVEEIVQSDESNLLLDARAANRYRGETEPMDKIAGHIPGALNFDWEQLKENNEFEFNESIKAQLDDVINSAETVTVYCGSGVTATPIYAALKHFGYDNIRLYVGSYSDWISKEGAKIEKA